MEWTREKTLSLINEYRKRRGLWDMTHDDYRKKEVKQSLLMEVSTSLGGDIAIMEIEKKFHTLRTQYHREINRMKRKEPYNSKWFGFKNLQFLSSPKACRSQKGRIKAEITEDGIVTTKYIMQETSPQHDLCGGGGSADSTTNMNDGFLTLRRKPTNTYEAGGNGTGATSRSRELEKLIEETTKDVEHIDENKPKITIKEITVSMDNHSFSAQLQTGSSSDLSLGDQDPLLHDENQSQDEEDDEEPIETIDIQPVEEEAPYTQAQAAAAQHPQPMPTRIIKIQRRDTGTEDEYYDDQQQPGHQMNTLPGNSAKRIYYGNNYNNSHQLASIMPTSTPNVTQQIIGNPTLLNQGSKLNQQQRRVIQRPQLARDQFTTYGEYVANEMRGIMNREVLASLKHKINIALFEASMAELK